MIAEALIWLVLLIAFVGSLTVTKSLLTERRRNQLVFFSALAIALREMGEDITLPPLLNIKVSEKLQEPAALFVISAVFLAYFLRLFSEGTSAISKSASRSPEDKTAGPRFFTNIALSPFSLLIDVVGPLLITILALNGNIVGTIEVWRDVFNYGVDSLKQISVQGIDDKTSPFILIATDEILQFLGTGIERVIGRFADIPNQIRSLKEP